MELKWNKGPDIEGNPGFNRTFMELKYEIQRLNEMGEKF